MASFDLDCVIKFGGSAVTIKSELETIRLEEISSAASMILKLVENGMKFIVVHGAGSFGHHQAKMYEVNGGVNNDHPEKCRKGFCLTRCSVTKLNKIIVDALVDVGVNAVSQSPCGVWMTCDGSVVQDGVTSLMQLVTAGYVPVTHGDCVLDTSKGCAILSGDTIIHSICQKVAVERVVFLTDVAGIYTHPLHHPESALIPKVVVGRNGALDLDIQSDQHHHDVTGGIELKVRTSVEIVSVSMGKTNVFVCEINSRAATRACLSGELDEEGGTLITSGPEQI